MIKAEVVFLQQHLSCIDRLGIPVHSAIISEHIVAMFSIPCVYATEQVSQHAPSSTVTRIHARSTRRKAKAAARGPVGAA